MKMSRILCAVLALTTAGAGHTAAPLQKNVEIAAPDFGRVIELSLQMTKLRDAARRVSVRINYYGSKGMPSHHVRGIYLGDGLVATPFLEGVPRGALAFLTARDRSVFRLRALDSATSPSGHPLVTFFALRDAFGNYAPPKGGLVEPGWRQTLGDMVIVHEGRKFRSAMIRSSLGFTRQRAFTADAKRPNEAPYLHMIDLEASSPGAVVLASNSKLVGLMIGISSRRNVRPRRRAAPNAEKPSPETAGKSGDPKEQGPAKTAAKTPAKTAAKPNAEEEAPKTPPIYCVIDAGWLQRRGKLALDQSLPKLPPSLGLRMGSVRNLPGFRVSTVFRGSPAHQAGVRSGDQWVQINGKDFTAFEKQLVQAIQTGKPLIVQYRRRVGGDESIEGQYTVVPR